MTNYFIDHDAVDAEDTANTYTFTNGSDQIEVPGDQTSFWQVDDYIRSNDATEGKEWYKVTGVSYASENDKTIITIDHAFYQNTHTAGAQKNSQYRLWKADNGASGNGQSPSNAFCHIQQFFDVAQAGDVGYLRRGKTYYISAKITDVNDGTATSPIVLMGDDGTGWPDETGLEKPVIDGQGRSALGDYEGLLYLTTIQYFEAEDIVFDNFTTYEVMTSWSGAVVAGDMLKLKSCDAGSNLVGKFLYCDANPSTCHVSNCDFSGLLIGARADRHVYVLVEDCSGLGDLRGAYVGESSKFFVRRSSFYTGKPAYLEGVVYLINCPGADISSVTVNQPEWEIHLEDGVVQITKLYYGTIERDGSVYTGSASSSVKVTPTSYTDFMKLQAFEWKITGVTASSHTVTVQVRGSGWTSFPNADELYIEVEYYDEATGTHTATARSTDVLSANDTWTSFSVSFTPAQDGDIYVRGYLKKYESGAVVWFNGEIEIT